jgi:hypothetical protein
MDVPAGDWGAQFRWSFGDPAALEALARHRPAMATLGAVYDNDGLWDWGDPRGEGPKSLCRMVDQYADAGARAVVWGCGNNLAWSYVPRVQEAWCDRVPRDEANLARLAERQRQWLDCGTSPLDVVADRAQTRGLPVLAGFRINRFFARFGVEPWFANNPQVVLSPGSCPLYPNQQSANLALPEVREHFARGALDVVERYPVAGLHLEFMRAVPFFELGEPDKAGHVHAFLRLLRQGLDRIGQEQGRHLELSIWSGTEGNYRVIRQGLFPPEFMRPQFHGIEHQAWIEEGLVDRLILSTWSGPLGRRGQPVDLVPWMRLAHGRGTLVLGEVDNAAEVSDPASLREAEQVIRQISALSDGIFLFNTQPYHLALLLEGAAT